jgi:hypothetical protein
MWFTEDLFLHTKKNVGYLDLFRICEDAHTVVMGPDNNIFVGKTEAEIAKIRAEEQDQKKLGVATYIGNTFLTLRQESCICTIHVPVCWS